MNILHSIRSRVSKNLRLKQFVEYYIVPSGLFDKWFLKVPPTQYWDDRTNIVVSSPDNQKIPRVTHAGKIKSGKQVMHNGLEIILGSYYGPEVSKMLELNKGVHEPQEEYAFQVVLADLKLQKKKSYTMIELGSFWAFYSMWFKKELPVTENYMVEPDKLNLGFGTRNFKQNDFKGTFINAFVSDKKFKQNDDYYVSIDSLVNEYSLSYVDIIHCDIQGYEMDMLRGAIDSITCSKIGYLFISTHSNDLHKDCISFLEKNNFLILASANLEETYSYDGLVVARHSSITGPNRIDISIKS